MTPSEVPSTAAIGFGAGFSVGFLASSLARLYDHNPLPDLAEQTQIQRRVELVAASTGLVGAAILLLGSSTIHRTLAGAMLASSAFSVGILVHSALEKPVAVQP